jgi:phenylacetate-CoA ligase
MEEPCPCGRTSFRLAGISGRIGEAVKIRGMFVTPSQLKLVASKLGNPKFQVVVDRSLHRDILAVMIEIPADGIDTIKM